MREIEIRRLKFRFDPDVSFQWNPGNPWCGNFFNIITFVGPAFERYFIRAVVQATPRIKDEKVRREANLFCQQEGQHALHHVAHLRLLNERYPGLDGVQRKIMDSYDTLFERNSLQFSIYPTWPRWSCSSPPLQSLPCGTERFFGGSDPRIASFMLWHLVEEFEHRRCASEIYDDVVGDYWFRVRNLSAMVRHLNAVGTMAAEGIKRLVPASDNVIAHDKIAGMLRGATGRLALVWGLLATLFPGHDQGGYAEPEWIRRWFEAADGGQADMTLYYPRAAWSSRA